MDLSNGVLISYVWLKRHCDSALSLQLSQESRETGSDVNTSRSV